MKKKIGLLLVVIALGCGLFMTLSNVEEIIEPEEIALTLPEDAETRDIEVELKTITLDTSAEDFSYYDLSVQDEIQEQIDTYNEENTSIDDMTLIFNAYGTNTVGLYAYFNLEDITKVTYVIDCEGYNSYMQSIAMDDDLSNVEMQLIGLVGGELNTVTLYCYIDETVVESVSFDVTAPEIKGGYTTQVEVSTEDITALDDGLYGLLGLQFNYDGCTYFIDNYGTVRIEYALDGDVSENILFYDDCYLTSVDLCKMAFVNNLGKVTAVYDTGDQEIHHDYQINEYGQIIALTTCYSGDAVEDRIISIDIETGEVNELIDLGDVFPEYKVLTNVFNEDTTFQNYLGELDWIHVNTLQLVDEDSMIISSRETNTIIKLSNIYDEVEIEYLIGDPAIWANTAYAEYSYTAIGDFVYQAGQHTVTYLEDDSLEDGQYYLYLYNNNYYCYESRLTYFGYISGAETTFYEDNNAVSMYYLYLVDENEGTFELVDEIEVEYSSIVSSTQWYGDELIINSGMQLQFSVYDENHNLLATYYYQDEETPAFLGYRVYKYSFEDFYFE